MVSSLCKFRQINIQIKNTNKETKQYCSKTHLMTKWHKLFTNEMYTNGFVSFNKRYTMNKTLQSHNRVSHSTLGHLGSPSSRIIVQRPQFSGNPIQTKTLSCVRTYFLKSRIYLFRIVSIHRQFHKIRNIRVPTKQSLS